MIRFCAMTLSIGWLGAAHAACEKKLAASVLARHISRSDAAFSEMKEEDFRSARWDAQQALVCLGEPLQPGQAAAYHRMEALGAFLDGNHSGAIGDFRALIAVAPNYDLPETIAPDGHPLRYDFDVAIGLPRIEGAPAPAPTQGRIQVDGEVSETLPNNRPYIFQYIDGVGAVAVTSRVEPGLPPPRYPARKVRKSGGGIGLNIPLISVAGGAAVTAAVTYALAAQNASSFWDPGTPQADLEGLRGRTNTLGWVSVGAGVVAVGTGAAAVVVGQW